MTILHIDAFLVHPGKSTGKSAAIVGSEVPLSGSLFDLLNGVYEKSDRECDVDITFSPTHDGRQQNDCRDLILAYLSSPKSAHGQKIAERLSIHTDRRSGLGLLFLIAGKVGRLHKIVLSRFPTDSAIYVEEGSKVLKVELLERVFMKNKTSYKAVLYQHASLSGGFWLGRAIDRQLNQMSGEPSNYWISDFLLSDFTTTSAHGTRRLATALREAAKKSSLSTRHELSAASTLAAGFGGVRLNINDFFDRLKLSNPAREAVLKELKSPKIALEKFEFNSAVYKELIGYRSMELDNGAMLTAPTERFNRVFVQEATDGKDGEIKISTKGKLVDEKLKTIR